MSISSVYQNPPPKKAGWYFWALELFFEKKFREKPGRHYNIMETALIDHF